MKILVTGGEGFIAKNISEFYSGAAKVTAPNSKELNLLDFEKVATVIKKNKYDIIIHSATYDAAPATSTKDKNKVLEYNLRMFFNLARMKAHFGKLIYFGSGAEFDRAHWKPKMKESYYDTFVPSDAYGFSKYLMTKHTLQSKNIYNLRLFGVFGRYEDWRYRFISNICFQALTSKKLIIQQNAFYDFTHIEDLLKVVKWAVEKNPPKSVYNVCAGNAVERKVIAEEIKKISGKPLKIEIENRKMGTEYSGNNQLLLNDMKGFKFTPIEQSLEIVYNWYKNNSKLFLK